MSFWFWVWSCFNALDTKQRQQCWDHKLGKVSKCLHSKSVHLWKITSFKITTIKIPTFIKKYCNQSSYNQNPYNHNFPNPCWKFDDPNRVQTIDRNLLFPIKSIRREEKVGSNFILFRSKRCSPKQTRMVMVSWLDLER